MRGQWVVIDIFSLILQERNTERLIWCAIDVTQNVIS